MKGMSFMCKKYTFPGNCNGRLQGMCWECPNSDAIIGYFCDNCGTEIDPEEESDLCETCREWKEE